MSLEGRELGRKRTEGGSRTDNQSDTHLKTSDECVLQPPCSGIVISVKKEAEKDTESCRSYRDGVTKYNQQVIRTRQTRSDDQTDVLVAMPQVTVF